MKALEEKFDVHYVVNNRFEIEKPLAQQALKHKGVFIHPASDIEQGTMNNLKKIISKNDHKKVVIVDNFTYQLSLDFLSWVTITGRGDRAGDLVGQLNTLREDAGQNRSPDHERIDRALKRAAHWGDLDRNERGPRGERLAFPINAYKSWVDQGVGRNVTRRRFLRDFV